MEEISYCRHCKLYVSHHPAALGKHEKHCWANPESDGSKNTDFSCIACGERLITKAQLAAHRREFHAQIKTQQCSHCQREWNTTDIRRAIHESRCHQNRDSSYTCHCPHCHRRFSNEDKLSTHEPTCRESAIWHMIFTPTKYSAPNNRGVYSITTPNGKVYIGMTARLGFKARRMKHLKSLSRGKHHCAGLQRSYNTYGKDGLMFQPLEQYIPVNDDEIAALEKHILLREKEIWDEYHDNGIALYNARPTGTGSVYHSEESREKRRIAYYLSNNSSCQIWNRICLVCGDRYTTNKEKQRTCSKDSCMRKNLLYNQYTSVRRPPMHLCKGENCCNLVVLGDKYCGFSCSYINCQSPICCNYMPRDRRSGPYCNKACKEGRGELNPELLKQLHHNRGMSTHDIGKLLGYSAVAVQLCMKKNDIDRLSLKDQEESKRALPRGVELRRLYLEEKLSMNELMRRYRVSEVVLKRYLSEADIPLRRGTIRK